MIHLIFRMIQGGDPCAYSDRRVKIGKENKVEGKKRGEYNRRFHKSNSTTPLWLKHTVCPMPAINKFVNISINIHL